MKTIQTLPSRFYEAVRSNQDKDALLYFEGTRLMSETFSALHSRIGCAARILKNNGFKPGDRVVLLIETSPDFVVSFLAVLSLGGVCVPLDVQYSCDDIVKLGAHAGAKIIITQKKFSLDWPHAFKQICVEEFHLGSKESVDMFKECPAYQPDDEDALAALFYTSGTTGDPKAVMLTHKNFLANVDSIRALNVLKPDDVFISVLPLHHTYALTTTLLLPLISGITISYPRSLASSDVLFCIKQTCATIFVSVPQVFEILSRNIFTRIGERSFMERCAIGIAQAVCFGVRRFTGINLARFIFRDMHQAFGPAFRLMISGGAKLDPEVAKAFYRWGFTLLQGYGLTETSPVVSLSLSDSSSFSSVGPALPGVEVKVCDPDSFGIGEIAVRGNNVMKGYYSDKEATDAVIREGWFFTGDEGFIDRHGSVTITGRKNDMLVLSSGKNIHPEELESLYAKAGGVKECAVFLHTESIRDKQMLVAVIVIDDDYFRQTAAADIRGRLKWELENIFSQMPSYKRIGAFQVSLDPLPRTRLGKIKRFELPALYQRLKDGREKKQGEAPAVGFLPADAGFVRQKVFGFLKERLGRTILDSDHLEIDLGLDSLARVEILIETQQFLGLELSEDQMLTFFSCQRVGELFGQLEKILGERAGEFQPDEDMAGLQHAAEAYIRKVLNVDVQPDDHFELDLGLDSLGRVELFIGLQQYLGLEISDDQMKRFFQCQTISELRLCLNDMVLPGAIHGNWHTMQWSDILKKEPENHARMQIEAGTNGFAVKLATFFAVIFLKGIFHCLWWVSIEGRENVARKGPFLIAPNHVTFLDALLIFSCLPFKVLLETFFLGDARFLESWYLKRFRRVWRLLPITFDYRMARHLQLCAYVYRQGKNICYFPEGERSFDGTVQKFRKGIGILIKECGCDVVPAAIVGGHQIWPRGQRFPRLFKPIKVVFGKPVSSEELMFKLSDEGDMYTRIAQNLREKVATLYNK